MPETDKQEVTKAEQLIHFLSVLNQAPVYIIQDNDYKTTYKAAMSSVSKEFAL
jgi:hypothetical protein